MGAGPDVAATATPRSMCCDQAIFTSIPSPMGRGYRLVACSPGLRPEEKQHIVTRSPSHDGLCDDSPEAVGVSFYPLPTGRLCVAHSCHAGAEHTARGGQLVYTRIVTLEADAFEALDNNPFNVLRALTAGAGEQPDLKPPASLPPLELTLSNSAPTAALADLVSEVGPAWVAAAVAGMLEQTPVVVLGDFTPSAFLEALVLSVPIDLRPTFGFSGGLRYSAGRGFAVTVLHDPKAGQLKRTLKGRNLALLDQQSHPTDLPRVTCSWSRLVQRLWEQGKPTELLAFASERFPDTSLEFLQRYGRLRLRCETLDGATTADLITLVNEQLGETVTDELAARLAIGVTSAAIARLTERLAVAPIDELTAHWGELAAMWQRSNSTGALLAGLTAGALKRATRLEPMTAAKMAVELVGTASTTGAVGPVQTAINDLLDHLVEWVHDQPPESVAALTPLLQRWGDQCALAGRIAQLEARMATRRRSCQPQPIIAADL